MRSKRSLFDDNGKETDEYRLFLDAFKALDKLSGPQRANQFIIETAKIRSLNKRQFNDWGPIFGKSTMSYSSAIEHVTNELHEKKERITNYDDFVKRVGKVSQNRGFSSEFYSKDKFSSDPEKRKRHYDHAKPLNDWSRAAEKMGGKSYQQLKKELNGPWRESGEVKNPIRGGTNTDSRNDGNENKGFGVGREEDRKRGFQRTSMKSKGGRGGGFFDNDGEKSGIDSDNLRSSSQSCGESNVRRRRGISFGGKKVGLSMGSAKCGTGGSRGLGGMNSGSRIGRIKNSPSRKGIGMSSGRRASGIKSIGSGGGIKSSASRG